MQITVEYLKEKNACTNGLNWFANQKETDAIQIIKKLIVDKDKIKLKYDESYFLWANWLISRILSKIDCGKYAVFAAENVLHIFEKEYPLDGRPRAAIEAVKNFIKNPNKENANAANAANAIANAAYAAAYAADVAYAAAYAANAVYAAANAAYTYASAAAVANAAYAAANAAAAVADVAYAAANAAAAVADVAYAAAYAAAAADKLKIRIINYGVELLKKY